MVQRDPNTTGGDRSTDRVPPWLLALAGVTVVLVVAVVALVVIPAARDRYDESEDAADAQVPTSVPVSTSTTGSSFSATSAI